MRSSGTRRRAEIGRGPDSASAQPGCDARTALTGWRAHFLLDRLDEHARGSRRRWSSWIARWAQNPVQ